MSDKQKAHDKLMEFCDKLNNQFQTDGVPLVVIPVHTLIKMQAILSQHESLVASLNQSEPEPEPSVILDPNWGVDIGLAGGSPLPEHVHLCRDTAQDIINSKKRR